MRIGLYRQGPAKSIGGVELCLALVADTHQRRHDVDIIHSSTIIDAAALRHAFDLELGRVRFVRKPVLAPRSGGSLLQRYKQFAEMERALSRGYDVFVAFTHGPPPRCHARQGVLHVLFPLQPLGSLGSVSLPPAQGVLRTLAAVRSRRALLSYRVRTAPSSYTRQWTKRRWGVACDVVYPPAWDAVASRVDERVILVIGRFTRNKNQLELIRAFARLRDLHEKGWRMHCAGNVGMGADDREYFAACRSAARGMPCKVEADLSRFAIREALRRGSIFWLATGYRDELPETAEHFGVATLEAMAAGCVPFAVDRGGSREIIQNGVSGFLWGSLDTLTQQTRLLAGDQRLRERMLEAARRRAAEFDRESFVRGLRII